jgi:hypothetical protein
MNRQRNEVGQEESFFSEDLPAFIGWFVILANLKKTAFASGRDGFNLSVFAKSTGYHQFGVISGTVK